MVLGGVAGDPRSPDDYARASSQPIKGVWWLYVGEKAVGMQ